MKIKHGLYEQVYGEAMNTTRKWRYPIEGRIYVKNRLAQLQDTTWTMRNIIAQHNLQILYAIVTQMQENYT